MTAAIQAAVNQSNQFSGAPVYIRIGKYKIVSSITARITQPLRIYGDGMGMTTLVQTVDAHAFAIAIAKGCGARIEGINITNSEFVDCLVGVRCVNSLGVAVCGPGGLSGGGTIDISYINSPFISLNAGAGTITGITGRKVGQRITIACDTAGDVLQHNARQIMPGNVNYTFTAGGSVDLYRINSNTWRAVGHP
jgi:hypothetical protein